MIMPPLTPSASLYNSQVLICMQQQNWQPHGSALGRKPIQFISIRLKRQCAHRRTKRGLQVFRFQTLTQQRCNRKTEIRHSHTETHTLSLYLQGSKHHHFLLRALNFLQQDSPLGLFIELVHSDGIILWRDVNNQTNKL